MSHRQASFSLLMLLCSGLIATALMCLGGAVTVYAQGFVTSVRLDCVSESSAGIRLELFRDGVLLRDDLLTCTDGGATAVDLVTTEEPNAWRLGGSVQSPGQILLCSDEAGTRFPELYECGIRDTRAHLIAFRPRSAD